MQRDSIIMDSTGFPAEKISLFKTVDSYTSWKDLLTFWAAEMNGKMLAGKNALNADFMLY